jgi:hypothetical protein
MDYRASNPKAVRDKLRECEFFLKLIAEYREKLDDGNFQRLPDELLFCLSAFLNSFRTTAYRLIGVVRHTHGPDAGRKLRDRLIAHADVGFLKDLSDLETHGDGAVVWARFKLQVPYTDPERWQPRYVRPARLQSRWRRSAVVQVVDWRFDRRPDNIVDLCTRALTEMQKFIGQALP